MVLMEAERAWSYAMQLKQEANTEPRKRFHLLSRLRKAAKHSENLEKLCESPRVDAKTKLEAQVGRSEAPQMKRKSGVMAAATASLLCVSAGLYRLSDWHGGV